MNTARVREDEYKYSYNQTEYTENPIQQENPVIEGYFPKEKQMEISIKAMAIKKINTTLCGLLGTLIVLTFISYYFSMTHELRLNTLNRQIIALNDENAELETNLERLKSFNNVDNKMTQNNTLQKAEKVIEVQAVNSAVTVEKKTDTSAPFNWAIGY